MEKVTVDAVPFDGKSQARWGWYGSDRQSRPHGEMLLLELAASIQTLCIATETYCWF
jgi:hypothetical protein